MIFFRSFPSNPEAIEMALSVTPKEAQQIWNICKPLPPIHRVVAINDIARTLAITHIEVDLLLLRGNLIVAAMPIYDRQEWLLVMEGNYELVNQSHFPSDLIHEAIQWLIQRYGNLFANPIHEMQENKSILFRHPGAPFEPGLLMVPLKGIAT